MGEALDIEGKMEGLGEKIKSSVGKGEDGKFTEGFVGLSLVICVGAMAIVGSIQDGVSGDFSLLLSKSVLDFSFMPALRSEAVDAAVIIKHRGIAHTSVKAQFASLIK